MIIEDPVVKARWDICSDHLCGMNQSHTREHSDVKIENQNGLAWNLRAYRKPQQNLFLQGGPGLGKTFLARCLLRDFIDPPQGTKEPRLIAALDELTFHEIAHSFEPVDRLRFYVRADLLLFDDIDKVTWDYKNLMALKHLLGHRFDNGDRTIFTSNANSEGIRNAMLAGCANAALISACLDRFKPCKTVELQGQSFRGGS